MAEESGRCIYTEERNAGNKYREKQLAEILELIEERKKDADYNRARYFTPDFSSIESYMESTCAYRNEFIKMLGWPLTQYSNALPKPEAEIEFVAEDDFGKIYRLNIRAMPKVNTYGILFLPKGNGPFPLIIAQHGGLGTPELCSGFFGSDNYNDMTRRVLKNGVAVFCPQLLLWADEFGPEYNRQTIDQQLKQLGGSITALEIFKIRRSIDYFLTREDIIHNQIGMIGLSYGGFYTLFTTAVDLRIQAALSSCFFNNRHIYGWHDWTWFNSANTFFDAEVCALICPRPLYIEVAKNDELFDVKYAAPEYKKVMRIYEQLGVSQSLKYKEFNGVHELDKDNEGISFICNKIKNM